MGYSFEQAVADLLDNSIQAGAGTILVRIVVRDTEVKQVQIADDGVGMTLDGLLRAARFGSDSQHTTTSLGKFGMGLKLASLSQCRSFTVVSAQRHSPACGWEWTVEGMARQWSGRTLVQQELAELRETPFTRIPN